MLANKVPRPANTTTSIASANQNSSGISMPAVPPFQKVAARQQDNLNDNAIPEKEADTLEDRTPQSEVVQLVIDDSVLVGSRIVVDYLESPRVGMLGAIVAHSARKPDHVRVRFDNDPGRPRWIHKTRMSVISRPGQELNDDEPGQEQQLKAMIGQVIQNVIDAPDEIRTVMESDKTSGITVAPEDQLRRCLAACRTKSAQEVAIYLYTTYFYGPLNRYLRDPEHSGIGESVKPLIRLTNELLTQAFQHTPGEVLIQKFRMELRSEWIGDKEEGDTLSFPGFTSTHPSLRGVNKMWSDIASGAFGEVTKLALLIFEGSTRILRPVTKYFPREVEDIIPSGKQATIVQKYDINWTDPDDEVWVVTVYHLMLLPAVEPSNFRVEFVDSGNIEIVDEDDRRGEKRKIKEEEKKEEKKDDGKKRKTVATPEKGKEKEKGKAEGEKRRKKKKKNRKKPILV